MTVLVPRQEMTGADRTWAQRYQVNDILRYSRSSRDAGIDKGEYASVTRIDAERNLLTVARADGTEQTYDPRRQMGVTVYREVEKAFVVGDRVQFTAPNNRFEDCEPRAWNDRKHDAERSDPTDAGQWPQGNSRFATASAHRPWIRCHELLQPGPDRRPSAHPR
jgi:hypothetical protein